MDQNVTTVETRLAGSFQFKVHVNGETLEGRVDEGEESIGRRAAHLLGRHGWLVNCSPHRAFELVSLDTGKRIVEVRARLEAVVKSSRSATSAEFGANSLSWNQRKHPEAAAEIAKRKSLPPPPPESRRPLYGHNSYNGGF